MSRPGLLAKADRLGRHLENGLLALLLAGMLGLGSAQIFLRNFVGGGLAWADEALRIMVLWLALLGAVAASRDDRHISIDVLARVLPPRGAAAAGAVTKLFTSAVCLIMAWYSLSFVAESREYGDILFSGLPAWWFQAILPIAFTLIGYRYAILALMRLGALLRGGRRP